MLWWYLGNGLAECVQIWHTARDNMSSNNTCHKLEVQLHVRTSTPLFYVSETSGPIFMKFNI